MNKYAHLAPPKKKHPDEIRCLTKTRYSRQDAGEYSAARIRAEGGPVMRVYRCPMCLGWHLTSQV